MIESAKDSGHYRVYGPPLGEDGTIAFSAFGVENLRNLIEIHKANRR